MCLALRKFFVIPLALLVLHGLSFSQSTSTGGIAGTVKDISSAAVSGATVKITNNATKNVERTVVTGNDGSFSAPELPPGEYRIEITAKGFATYTGMVPVAITETTRVNPVLKVGTTTTTVEVLGAPTLVNTESAVTGQPIDSNTLASLPLPVPNFLFLLSLSSGTSSELPDVRAANRGIVDINVNGQRTSNNSLTLEGINVNDFNLAHFDTVPLPNPHVIEEFKVATSLYDSSTGNKGGGAVGLVFKTGTKDWHGEAYWNHRNDVFNANEWFFNHNGAKRGKFLQNVLGFSGSGPMPLAGGFWFANVQGLRARNAVDPNSSTTTATIPIFPTNPDGSTSATLLAPFAGGPVDPTAVNILNLKSNIYGGTFLIPRPGQPGCNVRGANLSCTFAKVAPIKDTQYAISYDRPWRGGQDKITGRWFWDNGNVNKPFGTNAKLAFPVKSVQNNRFLSLSEVHQISNRQLNDFRAGFSRYNSSFAPTDLVTLAQIGASRPNQATVPGIYHFDTSVFSLGTGVNDERGTIANSFYFGDSWSYSRGRHNMKAGMEFTDYQLNRFNRFAVRGDLTFDNFTNFLRGTINGIQSGVGDPQRYFRDRDYAFFYQDDWKALPRLTVNLGLRWDIFGYAHDKFLRGIIYDPRLLQSNPGANPFEFPEHSTLPGIVGTKGIGDCGTRKCREYKAFDPRVGLAWDVFGTGKTVVRSGYGIYYQRLSNQNLLQGSLAPPFFVQLISSNPPGVTMANPITTVFTPSLVASNYIPQPSRFAGLCGPAAAGNPCPGATDPNNPANIPLFVNNNNQPCGGSFGPGTAATVATNCSISLAGYSTPPPSPHTPYTQQWNLTVQQELGKGWAIEVGYVGSHYVHGLGIYNPFQARLASPQNPIVATDIVGRSYTITTNTINNEPLRSQALGISRRAGARLDGDIGTATYHSGQLTVSHRFAKGLYFQASYTYSKEIDNVSGSQSTDELNSTRNGLGSQQNLLGANILNDQEHPSANRARGDFDRPHRLSVSYVYQLPVPKTGIWGTQAFQGWSISGITTWQSGLPFSVVDSSGLRAFGGFTGTPFLASAFFTCGSLSQGIASGSVQSRVDAGYFNNGCFTRVPVVPFGAAGATGVGNMPRNAYRGPTQQNWDFAVAKRFKITERQGLDFRTDFFNIFNHPSFLPPALVNISAPATFGTINNTVGPARLIQFGFRYSF